MNKSLITNLVAFSVTFFGVFLENNILLTIGLFALSGALTNWLAIHMLFEKVPGLYGSGVVEDRFEQFKSSIRVLIMNQFFNEDNVKNFLNSEIQSEHKGFDLSKLIDSTDFSLAFDSLKSAVLESSFGGMLGMFGGEKALDPLKEPFEKKMKIAVNKIVHTQTFQETLQESLSGSDISKELTDKIELIVETRLNELNPKMVKELVQEMIKEHLGWLVVWGGVFGGVIGFFSSLVL